MSRRNPMDKERFLEGNRQKWVGIGLLIVLLVLLCNIMAHIDPSPYLQAVMLLIGAGVLGWSVDSAVKAYRVSSDRQTTTQDVREERRTEVTQRTISPKHFDDDEVP